MFVEAVLVGSVSAVDAVHSLEEEWQFSDSHLPLNAPALMRLLTR